MTRKRLMQIKLLVLKIKGGLLGLGKRFELKKKEKNGVVVEVDELTVGEPVLVAVEKRKNINVILKETLDVFVDVVKRGFGWIMRRSYKWWKGGGVRSRKWKRRVVKLVKKLKAIDGEDVLFRWRKMKRELRLFFVPREGNLSWRRVFKISSKNLVSNRARIVVTVGGVGVGIGAIVLLVSFSYGLQKVVTDRIIWPKALRVAEVLSESTKVKIDKEMIEGIEDIDGVEQVEASIRMAGQVEFEGSKIDTVVVGVTNDYLNLSNIIMKEGEKFSAEADVGYGGDEDITEMFEDDEEWAGQVAGITSEMGDGINHGDLVGEKTAWFRLRDDTFVPVYWGPKKTAGVRGYVKGSVLESWDGEVVWGGVYEDVAGWGRTINSDGVLMGKWIKSELPLWEDVAGVYKEMVNEEGTQLEEEVYVAMNDAQIMSEIEKKVEAMFEEGMILGEMDEEDSDLLQVGTESASLVLELSKEAELAEEAETEREIKVWDDNKKEVIVSQALLRAWNREADEVLGREIDLRYLVTSTILPRVAGRVLSEQVSYEVVGVVEEATKPLLYVPLGDMESMGVVNYSSLKVLVENEVMLPVVRAMIQDMGLVTKSVSDTLSQIARLFTIVRFLLGSFGAIALVVALFGMFNTLTVSLLERTREIGVMKSLGTTNVDVVRIFLTEAVIISAAGGIMGVLFGRFLGRLIDFLFFKSADKLGQSLFALPLWFSLFILVLALVVGVVTGWYPSRRASKISALNALRYE